MEGGADEMNKADQYLTSFYWTVQTITTVGYGDTSINTKTEKIACILLMVFGVVAFGLLSGSLTNILQNYDSSNAIFTEKVGILNNLYKDYCLPLDLYLRLKQSIRYNTTQNNDDINKFVADLPKNLAIELSLFIHETTYSRILFLRKNNSESFLAWICPLIKANIYDDREYIYFDGDDINMIYFLKYGSCGFVLPRYSNIKYINVNIGATFGLVDIIGNMLVNKD